MPGEAMHKKGADGAQRAKRWLDATTRTRASWTNEDEVAGGRLEFNWPHAGQEPYSFDVGGFLYGQPFDNHSFMAEVKNYSGDNLGNDYDDFLAKCYLTWRDNTRWANQFMFLTWHPFRIKTWTQLRDPDAIIKGCVANRRRLFGVDDEVEARAHVDNSLIDELKNRLWLVVLSEKQEQLLISDQDRALIVSSRIEKGLM
ncbi:hypothetical protein ABZ749_05405 [Micromonospora sp. NPDC047753]|uniref:hypothetical protein n=1 Tax=Micromonospora sp. NPDC047753 TaxID=3154817 RepID=UPI0033C96D1D